MLTQPKVLKAVIPAAGFGTRMLPATKALPKEMLPVAGKPLIQYAVEEAAASGIQTVILIIRNHKSVIQAHFAPDPVLESFLDERHLKPAADLVRQLNKLVDLQYVEQEKPLGLAHALCAARSRVGPEPFVVLLPDVIIVNSDPVTRQLIRAHEQHGGSFVAIREVAPQDAERYGIVEAEHSSVSPASKLALITRLVEKPSPGCAPSRLGVFGRYLLESSIWDAIAQTQPDVRGEVQLTDALNLFCRTNLLSGICFEGHHYDAGDPLGHLKASLELALQSPLFRDPLLSYLSQLEDVIRSHTA